uniref:Gigasin-4-like n=1 Tax=Crassostrea virginica TaxID=6565 RepID=A0A8B8AU50_CRAVI|nr:gigasin-4-like [Crassostrea virginica]
MEKSGILVILVVSLCLGLVCDAAVAPRQPIAMCVMDCMSEWLPCEYECRVEFPHNPRELKACALDCEQERASCMKDSPDPACNNNPANNRLHMPFKTMV